MVEFSLVELAQFLPLAGSLLYPAAELFQAAHFGKVGLHVHKAQGLERHGHGLQQCNTEGARGV